MQQTAKRYENTERPSARRPRNRRVSYPSLSTPETHQGGSSVRMWFVRNAGTIATAIGWVFIFIAIALPQAASYTPLRFDMCVCGSGCVGFAVGWFVCKDLK